MNINIEDIITAIKNDAGNEEQETLAEASVELVNAAVKVLNLYKDYYGKQKKYRYNGEAMTITDWSKKLGIPYHTLRKRIVDNGWSVEDAINTPVRNHDAVRNFHNKVTVLQYNYNRELVREFESIQEAARQLGINYQLVNKAIQGQDILEQVGLYGYYLATPKNYVGVVPEHDERSEAV